MKNSKETRTCIGCRNKFHKDNFIRIVKTNNSDIVVDFDKKLEGRGAYICKNIECFENVVKTKRLGRALKTNVSYEKYNELRGVIFDR